MHAFSLSSHARTRANQRGITHQMINDLLAHADIEAPVGGGCTVLRLSRQRLRDRDLKAELGSNPDKLAGLALIWSEDSAQVVTVMVDHGGAKGRRYRKAH